MKKANIPGLLMMVAAICCFTAAAAGFFKDSENSIVYMGLASSLLCTGSVLRMRNRVNDHTGE